MTEGVTVTPKYDAQSAEPCLVGKALANGMLLVTPKSSIYGEALPTTALRQLSEMQARIGWVQ